MECGEADLCPMGTRAIPWKATFSTNKDLLPQSLQPGMFFPRSLLSYILAFWPLLGSTGAKGSLGPMGSLLLRTQDGASLEHVP